MITKPDSHLTPWRSRLYQIIFEAETQSGKTFDILLVCAITLSVIVACLESVQEFRLQFGSELLFVEWFFTVLFTIEYVLRLICVRKPFSYVFSFFGVIDLLAILPSYLSVYFAGAHSLIVIRSIRLLRVFRLFKMGRFVGEADVLVQALKGSRHKITVFILAVLSIVVFAGTLMYLVEGEENGFTSIPKSMYWAIVTMTTVGYGDLIPQTEMGRTFASILMILGYGVIAIPTGIVSVEIANATNHHNTRTCPNCLLEGHTPAAKFCRMCGEKL